MYLTVVLIMRIQERLFHAYNPTYNPPPTFVLHVLLCKACACRVCVDLCSLLAPGEGMLVGNFARAAFLVHSECTESRYINSRPFRVNAGPVGVPCTAILRTRGVSGWWGFPKRVIAGGGEKGWFRGLMQQWCKRQ